MNGTCIGRIDHACPTIAPTWAITKQLTQIYSLHIWNTYFALTQFYFHVSHWSVPTTVALMRKTWTNPAWLVTFVHIKQKCWLVMGRNSLFCSFPMRIVSLQKYYYREYNGLVSNTVHQCILYKLTIYTSEEKSRRWNTKVCLLSHRLKNGWF